jgi:hypothetical protein
MKLTALVRWVLGGSSLLLGLSGCVAMLDAGDGFAERGIDPRELPDSAAFQSSACGVDEMRERVCGSLASPVDRAAEGPFWDCPEEPKQLTGVGPAMLFYSDLKKLEFDRRMTLSYREQKNASCGDEGERKGECCYSRCTALPVAKEASREVPAGYHEQMTCVDAPQGGTRFGAAGFSECPNALAFGAGPSPFEADPFDGAATERLRAKAAEFFSDTPRCCYRTLERAE